MARVRPHDSVENVYWIQLKGIPKKLGTVNRVPGRQVYGERLFTFEDREYRIWDSRRSKLAATIVKNPNTIPSFIGKKVLYLGAASGTTVSHVSDIIGNDGRIFAVEFAPRSGMNLVGLSKQRNHIYPILKDARKPELYADLVDQCDIVFCDVAQPTQAAILAKNVLCYMKRDGKFILAIKARSIDTTANPEKIYRKVVTELKRRELTVDHLVRLDPLERDHAVVIGGIRS